ncbi:hypothetical protein BDA99DRAFT_536222 [Phascolomyces articulosus]|uniref:Uncharacterized protein n=1 Tax=Phascolomyces articulosus TaxID=60185 RepID=A0AAD5KHM5_9FUNG|nr:hypothetical protein BDA99DRAFT_536222 [Phascolomyces articulosus]
MIVKRMLENDSILWSSCGAYFDRSTTYEDTDEDEDIVLDLLQLVVDNNCDRILSMTFMYCGFKDQERFLSQLMALGGNIKTLEFVEHSENLPFLSILNACPNLERFGYSPYDLSRPALVNAYYTDPGEDFHFDDLSDDTYDGDSINEGEADTLDTSAPVLMFPKMIILSIDLVMSFRNRLEPIISRCPNLRVLRTGNVKEHAYSELPELPSSETTNMKRILKYC